MHPSTDDFEFRRNSKYKYPNSGGYIGYLDYILDMYSSAIAIQAKSDCADDQGELIKALARNHSAFKIDHQAAIFQTLFGTAKADVVLQDGRPFNKATGTRSVGQHTAVRMFKKPTTHSVSTTPGRLVSACLLVLFQPAYLICCANCWSVLLHQCNGAPHLVCPALPQAISFACKMHGMWYAPK